MLQNSYCETGMHGRCKASSRADAVPAREVGGMVSACTCCEWAIQLPPCEMPDPSCSSVGLFQGDSGIAVTAGPVYDMSIICRRTGALEAPALRCQRSTPMSHSCER